MVGRIVGKENILSTQNFVIPWYLVRSQVMIILEKIKINLQHFLKR